MSTTVCGQHKRSRAVWIMALSASASCHHRQIATRWMRPGPSGHDCAVCDEMKATSHYCVGLNDTVVVRTCLLQNLLLASFSRRSPQLLSYGKRNYSTIRYESGSWQGSTCTLSRIKPPAFSTEKNDVNRNLVSSSDLVCFVWTASLLYQWC